MQNLDFGMPLKGMEETEWVVLGFKREQAS